MPTTHFRMLQARFNREWDLGLRYKLRVFAGESMKDPYVVLRQKEQDMERVHRNRQLQQTRKGHYWDSGD